VKKEVERLIEANFIRPCRYAEWISNIVPVYKKNGKNEGMYRLVGAECGPDTNQ
jgi:hypothetical protein